MDIAIWLICEIIKIIPVPITKNTDILLKNYDLRCAIRRGSDTNKCI